MTVVRGVHDPDELWRWLWFRLGALEQAVLTDARFAALKPYRPDGGWPPRAWVYELETALLAVQRSLGPRPGFRLAGKRIDQTPDQPLQVLVSQALDAARALLALPPVPPT